MIYSSKIIGGGGGGERPAPPPSLILQKCVNYMTKENIKILICCLHLKATKLNPTHAPYWMNLFSSNKMKNNGLIKVAETFYSYILLPREAITRQQVQKYFVAVMVVCRGDDVWSGDKDSSSWHNWSSQC